MHRHISTIVRVLELEYNGSITGLFCSSILLKPAKPKMIGCLIQATFVLWNTDPPQLYHGRLIKVKRPDQTLSIPGVAVSRVKESLILQGEVERNRAEPSK